MKWIVAFEYDDSTNLNGIIFTEDVSGIEFKFFSQTMSDAANIINKFPELMKELELIIALRGYTFPQWLELVKTSRKVIPMPPPWPGIIC